MELFYNPGVMPESELKATFVAREGLLEELLKLIERQPKGAGVQQVVIIAPRGMGKTTLLLMLNLSVRDGKLGKKWQPVRFAEESYGIYDLADFWMEVLNRLIGETNDDWLRKQVEQVRTEYKQSDQLRDAAFALIKDWSAKRKRRLLLLIDNFDEILSQINNELENARLRDVLMNDGTVMLVGGATTFFEEARAYDQPLYNFFRIFNLKDLNYEDVQTLLRKRAEIEGRQDFDKMLEENQTRVKTLQYFTGGNPRLVLMLYRVLASSEVIEVRRGLEKLLDEVTPFYKAKIEKLPPQQRKIVDQIARASAQTHEAQTPTQISEATRLKPNLVSTQLKRLADLGYVRATSIGRNSYYALSEPLYAIWHQMRFGSRTQWLVDFLRGFYSHLERIVEIRRLDQRFKEHFDKGDLAIARDVVAHQECLMESVWDSPSRGSALSKVLSNYLKLDDRDEVNRLVTSSPTGEIFAETKVALLEKSWFAGHNELDIISDGKMEMMEAVAERRLENALNLAAELLTSSPHDREALWTRAVSLYRLRRWEEAALAADQLFEVDPVALYALVAGDCYLKLHRLDVALRRYDKGLQVEPESQDARSRMVIYHLCEMQKEPGRSFEALREASKHFGTLHNKSELLFALIHKSLTGPARKLIEASGSIEEFFPILRAIDYIETRDESLIQILSPEVRKIVEEVIQQIQPTTASSKAPASSQSHPKDSAIANSH